MNDFFRCKCPVTSALDVIGDKWTLVIIKQMLFEEKSTFKDFVESQEHIATNILASRLKMLEKFEIVEKGTRPNNLKVKVYTLTNKGIGLIPTLIELMLWSKDYIQDFHPGLNIDTRLEGVREDKANSYKQIAATYEAFKKGLSVV